MKYFFYSAKWKDITFNGILESKNGLFELDSVKWAGLPANTLYFTEISHIQYESFDKELNKELID